MQGQHMKLLLPFLLLFFTTASVYALDGHPDEEIIQINPAANDSMLRVGQSMRVSVIGQGVAPSTTISPAQAYALAKRAATVDGYRLIAERIRGVYVEGRDTLQNMMVKNSNIYATVSAMIKNATVVDTKFQNGLCEVELEILLDYDSLQ